MKNKKTLLCALSLLFLAVSCSPGNPVGSDSESLEPTSSEKKENLYGENNIVIHFYKKDKGYSSYALWLWPSGGEGKEYSFTGEDDFGAYACVPISAFASNIKNLTLGAIVKSAGSWSYQTADMMVSFSEVALDSYGNASIWLKYNDTEVYFSEPSKHSLSKLEFDSLTSIKIVADDPVVSLKLKKDGVTRASLPPRVSIRMRIFDASLI